MDSVSLTAEEDEVIMVRSEHREKTLEEWSLSLLGRFHTTELINFRAAENHLSSVWKMEGNDLKITDLRDGVFLFRFSTESQLKWVIDNGPWSFDNHILLLRRWEKGMTASSVNFQTVPMWVQVWELPFDLINEEAGRDVGQGIGRVIEVDCKAIASFLRVRVDVPLDKPIRRGAPVLNPEGDTVRVVFKYERLCGLCFHCGLLGHEAKACKTTKLKVGEESPYGEWLRATEDVPPQTSDSHGIDGAEAEPLPNLNSGNGHSYHSSLVEEANPNNTNNEDLITTFCEITSSTREEALFFLESHNFHLVSAVSTFNTNNEDLITTFCEITSSTREEALFFLESHNFHLVSAVSTFNTNNEDLITTFCEITSSTREEALFFLESHNFHLDSAVSTFLDININPAAIAHPNHSTTVIENGNSEIMEDDRKNPENLNSGNGHSYHSSLVEEANPSNTNNEDLITTFCEITSSTRDFHLDSAVSTFLDINPAAVAHPIIPSAVAQSHRDGNPNGHGHSYHSRTTIPEIVEVVECTELKGPDINEEQYWESNDRKNPEINAILGLQNNMLGKSSSWSELIKWLEQKLDCFDLKLLISPGYRRLCDAFRLLLTDLKRLVVSLLSDKAVSDAILRNEAVRDLLCYSVNYVWSLISNEEPDLDTHKLMWILDAIKAIVKKLIVKFL